MRILTAIVGCSFLLLAACSGGGEAQANCEFAYWDGVVGTCLPNGWHVVDRAGLDKRGVPRDVLVAFQSDAPAAGQFPTVTVTREVLAQPVDAPTYSEASVQTVQSLPGYEQLDVRTVTIDDEEVNLHIFAAQPKSDAPKTRFYQVSVAGGGSGYTFTAAVPLSIESSLENQILLILQNATLRGGQTEG